MYYFVPTNQVLSAQKKCVYLEYITKKIGDYEFQGNSSPKLQIRFSPKGLQKLGLFKQGFYLAEKIYIKPIQVVLNDIRFGIKTTLVFSQNGAFKKQTVQALANICLIHKLHNFSVLVKEHGSQKVFQCSIACQYFTYCFHYAPYNGIK